MATRLPATDDLEIIQGADYVIAYRIHARDPDTGELELLNTTSFNAQLTVRATREGGQELFMSVGNGYIGVGWDPPRWQASTAYSVGDRVIPTASEMTGFVYLVTVAGTSDSSQPTWPTVLGNTVTNGTVTFKAIDTEDTITNLRLYFTHGLTEAAENWGDGYYDLKLFDAFDNRMRLVEGNARLSRQITR
jgi:hypothetical protein